VVDAMVPTVEVTPFPATVVDRLVLVRAGKPCRLGHRHRDLVRQLKVLCLAALVLALVCAYAFGVLGRDTAIGNVGASAMADPRQEAGQPTVEPALETIPLGNPWFSAPPTTPSAPPDTPRDTRPRGN
jgi:hypothetical protein